jgi:hypothetical protein
MSLLPASLRARLRSIRLLEPLQRRDFALLTAGSLVSSLGDGFFSVALAWQVYEISMGILLFVPGVRNPERMPIGVLPSGTAS